MPRSPRTARRSTPRLGIEFLEDRTAPATLRFAVGVQDTTGVRLDVYGPGGVLAGHVSVAPSIVVAAKALSGRKAAISVKQAASARFLVMVRHRCMRARAFGKGKVISPKCTGSDNREWLLRSKDREL